MLCIQTGKSIHDTDPHEVRRQPVLSSRAHDEMAPRLQGFARRAYAHARHRRALQPAPGESRQSLPAVRSPAGLHASTATSSTSPAKALPRRLEMLRPLQDARQAEAFARRLRAAPGARTRHHPADAVSRLLPHRLGLHPLRQGARHSRGPGPRIGRWLAGLLRARHHRHRSAAARVALRALPESRARRPCPISTSISA